MLKVVAAVSGRKAVAALSFDAAHYRRVEGASWAAAQGFSSSDTVQLWIGHEALRFTDDGSRTGLRAVHLALLRTSDGGKTKTIQPGWLLLWNGDVADRRERVRLEALAVDDGELVVDGLLEPMPLDVWDGTFVAASVGGFLARLAAPLAGHGVHEVLDAAHPFGPQALGDHVDAATQDAMEAILKEGATAVQPWADDQVNVGAQSSPGNLRTVRAESLTLALGLLGKVSCINDLGEPAAKAAVNVALLNAMQDGRRRLHYFQVAGDTGALVPLLLDPMGKLRMDDTRGLVGPGQPTFEAPGEVLVDGRRAPIVFSDEEQHKFRLAAHSDSEQLLGDPLLWLVQLGLLNHALTCRLSRDPADDDGNQRRLWVMFSMARWLRRNSQAPWAGTRRTLIAGALDRILGKLEAWKRVVSTKAGPIAVLSENFQPSRGHHGANDLDFQAAVQVLALAELEVCLHDIGPQDPLTVERVRALRRHGARGLHDLARIRREHAPRDGGPWGEDSRGATAPDVATAASPQLEAGAEPGDWWDSKSSLYGGTRIWGFEARAVSMMLDLRDGEPVDPEWVEDLHTFWLRCDALRPIDKHFPEWLPTAWLVQPLALHYGWSKTGFRDA